MPTSKMKKRFRSFFREKVSKLSIQGMLFLGIHGSINNFFQEKCSATTEALKWRFSKKNISIINKTSKGCK